MSQKPSEGMILNWARELYPGSNFGAFSQRHRPRICPFGAIVAAFPEDAKVLDVGCGSGLLLGLLASAGRIASGVGFDANAAVIQSANVMRRASSFEQVLRFEHVGVESPWPAADINTVAMIDVMHHIPKAERKGCISKVASILPKGGTFVYKDMADTPMWKALGNRFHDLILARDWISYSKMSEVISVCEEFNLRPLRSESWSKLWYAHELTVFEKS